MSIRAYVCFIATMLIGCQSAPLAQPPAEAAEVALPVVPPRLRPIANEAFKATMQIPDASGFSRSFLLGPIAAVQIKAGTLDDAAETTRAIDYAYKRDAMAQEVAVALAAAGRIEDGVRVFTELSDNRSWTCNPWSLKPVMMEAAIAAARNGREADADRFIDELGANHYCVSALTRIALRSDDPQTRFARALKTAGEVEKANDRAECYLVIAEAQVTCGRIDDARDAINKAVAAGEAAHDAWTEMYVQRRAAALWVRAGRAARARSAFANATAAVARIGGPNAQSNQARALATIAMDQAKLGMVDDAERTVALIHCSDDDWPLAAARDEALGRIAEARMIATGPKEAVTTAMRIEQFTQFRDDTLIVIARRLAAVREWDLASKMAEHFNSASYKAQALLEIAAYMVRAGQRDEALRLASRTRELELRSDIAPLGAGRRFAFDSPDSWGVLYDSPGFFTGATYAACLERAEGLAGAAMQFQVAITATQPKVYPQALSDAPNEVVRAVAKAHAESAGIEAAYEWARQIADPERRAWALLGVIEGGLARAEAGG